LSKSFSRLGYIYNSDEGVSQGETVPNSEEARLLCSKATTIVQQIAAFIGMTSATRQVISVAPLFHWHLQALINRVLPPPCIRTVNISQSRAVVVAPTNYKIQQYFTYSEATRSGDRDRCIVSGMGGNSDKLKSENESIEECQMHINCLELLAA